MSEQYIIGIDQSTQGTKAILMDREGRIVSKHFLAHRQIISPEGFVSHDGEEIYRNVLNVVKQLTENSSINKKDIKAIGISNQRETTIAWDCRTLKPVGPAIVWQCSRAKEITSSVTDQEFLTYVRENTGIPFSPYFPAAKAAWILKHHPLALKLAEENRLHIGTIDSWLINKLTQGKVFKTDYSNASRTQLFNLHDLKWDEIICERLHIPINALAEVSDSDGDFGSTTFDGLFESPIRIASIMGDSHAALFGQGCLDPGMAKATYGTGSSIMMNIGDKFSLSNYGLVTSLAWGYGGKVNYVLEGNINYSGAIITWLQKDLGLIQKASETSDLAKQANPEDTTYLIPAFSGLGAPYWQENAKAAFVGMSRTSGRNELVKASLEAIAYQVSDIVEAMKKDSGIKLLELRVDGGPSANEYLMQFQSDIADLRIRIPATEELSVIGVSYMAGIRTGLYKQDIMNNISCRKLYEPQMDEKTRIRKTQGWKKAVEKTF